MNLSIVVPLYNEEESLSELVAWIAKVMYDNNFTYEILLIDDGSTDSSWREIELLSKEYGAIRGLKFRRNYGKSAALYVGFEAAEGDVVVTMDADLQDNPEEIPEMYHMIMKEKYHLVSGWKKKRFDPIFSKNLPSKFYNWTARCMSGIKLHDFNCGLKAYKNEVVKSIEVYGDMHRYIPVLAKWAGYDKITEKVVQHQERKYGKTKFGIERFIRGPLDLMSVMFITRFGKKPMHLFGTWGMFVFMIGFFAAIAVGAKKLIVLSQGEKAMLVTESPYFYLALVCMIIGTQLFLSGFIGELVARSGNDRNKYHVDKEI
ncbi:MAG: glycosyltransferase family 2 protein [Salinivirgaceae bacterium]|nr:glycosyltransferase family 2 protein [Salinivirgaceae bacterium]